MFLNGITNKKRHHLLFIASAIGMAVLIAAGVKYVQYAWTSTVTRTEENAIKLTQAAAAGIPEAYYMDLSADTQNVSAKDYRQIRSSLAAVANLNNGIEYTHISVRKDNTVLFVVSSASENFDQSFPPGKLFSDKNTDDIRLWVKGETVISKPFSTNGSQWVSVLVPVKDTGTGKVAAVFGADFSAKTWYSDAIEHTIQSVFNVMFLFAIITGCAMLGLKNRTLRKDKRKLLELDAELKKALELFQTVFNQVPIGITIGDNKNFIYTGDKNSETVNPMFQKIVGRTKEQLAETSWRAITHPDDLLIESEKVKQFINGEIPGFDIEKRYIRPDGSTVWVRLIVAPLRLENMSFNHMCLVEDITERKRIEDALHESERAKAVLLDNLPGMAYRCKFDRSWTMEQVSNGCMGLTGYPPESLLQNAEISFEQIICPDFQEEVWEKWNKAVHEKRKYKGEYKIRTDRGVEKWVLDLGEGVYDNKDNLLGLEGIIIDITDSKQREIEIQYLYSHDQMTGLYNRQYFLDKIKGLDSKGDVPLSVITGDVNGIRLINNAFGYSTGDKILKEVADILCSFCRKSDIIARTGGDEFSILLPNTDSQTAANIMNTIKSACDDRHYKIAEETYSISISFGCCTKTSADQSMYQVYSVAGDNIYKRKLLERKSSHGAILSAIMAAMFAKSQETEEHAQRIAEISRKIGVQMGLPPKSLDMLRLFAMLHDVGKIGVDDRVLNKTGVLSEEEWTEMKKHPEIGYRIAISSPDLFPIAEFILTHHERWDGKGYPKGLKGEEIPPLSRILAVVDAYDAMTEDRIYRKGIPPEAAVVEIRKCSGTQFDPAVVDVFISLFGKID